MVSIVSIEAHQFCIERMWLHECTDDFRLQMTLDCRKYKRGCRKFFSQPFGVRLVCDRGVKRKTPLQQSVKAFFWWEQRESNPRPSACKADALNQLSYAPDFQKNLFFCGADGTRTRDPRRDRPVF